MQNWIILSNFAATYNNVRVINYSFMIKKYLVNGLATIALAATIVGCSHDYESTGITNVDRLANAAEKLGVEIDENQDWNMTTMLTANVTVALGLDQAYTVAVYDENPLFNKNAHYYSRATVKDGGTVEMSFNAPSASNSFYIAVFDSKFRRLSKSAKVENGILTAEFGTGASASRTTRAQENASTYPSFVKTKDDYLNPTLSFWGNQFTTSQINWSDYINYTPIDDNLIVNQTSNGNHTLTDASWSSNLNGAFPGHGDGKHFYVPEGITINEVFNVNAAYGTVNDVVIYIAGKVHLNGNTLNGPTLIVADGGEIILDGTTNMSNAGRFIVLAGGKITGQDGVAFNVNNGSACYNAGTIDFDGELNTNGTDFYNSSDGTINVDVLRNTSGGKFTNFGSITGRTNMQAADAYNSDIINGCHMHFTENIGIGTLTMLDNSRLDVDGRIEFNQRTQTLYNLSEINAGAIYVNSTTFSGPTEQGSFAVVKTDMVWANQGGDLNATNNVYFDWNDANLVNYQGVADYNSTVDNGYTVLSLIRQKNLNYVNESTSTFTIPAGDCTGNGYNDNGNIDDDDDDDDDDGDDDDDDNDIPGSPAVWTYAFEDTPLGDYDMNDVVIKVSDFYEDGEEMLAVTLCCTGASFNLHVYLDDTALFGGDEVHDVFGAPRGSFVNTGRGPDADYVTVYIRKPAGFDYGTADFWIESPAVPGGVHISKAGEDPHGIVVPADWYWPTEYTNIKDAYPNFVEFAKDASTTDPDVIGWYKVTVGSNPNPVPGKVY